MILAGGGIRSAQAVEPFRQLVNALQIPVIYSLMGVDILPTENPLRIGMLGSYGNRWTNLSLARADFLLVLGSRLDIRQTGAQTNAFKGERAIFHVDCEAGELNNRVVGCQTVIAQLRPFITAAASAAAHQPSMPDRSAWLAEITDLKAQWPDTGEQIDITGINPNQLMHDISRVSGAASAFVVDVGQHQMWAAQSLEPRADQRFLTSGGMGAMGFALPAAIGAALSQPERPVVMIAGDGGVQLNIQELQTVVRNKLPIKLIILNNNCHGMVRQFQQSYMNERYQSTLWGYSAPDFTQIARAYGIEGRTVSIFAPGHDRYLCQCLSQAGVWSWHY
jgi:acetolactate synthase-1/2/3 large subunit